MLSMTITHERGVLWEDFLADDPNPPSTQSNLMLTAPGPLFTLVRSRINLELRISSYSQTDTGEPDNFWWSGMFPAIGLWYNASATLPTISETPIANQNSDAWIMWDVLSGQTDSVIITPAGWHRWVRVWKFSGDILETFTNRQPHGAATQSVWLSWEWNDPNTFINHSHVTFDVVYDLAFNLGFDFFWKPRP